MRKVCPCYVDTARQYDPLFFCVWERKKGAAGRICLEENGGWKNCSLGRQTGNQGSRNGLEGCGTN